LCSNRSLIEFIGSRC